MNGNPAPTVQAQPLLQSTSVASVAAVAPNGPGAGSTTANCQLPTSQSSSSSTEAPTPASLNKDESSIGGQSPSGGMAPGSGREEAQVAGEDKGLQMEREGEQQSDTGPAEGGGEVLLEQVNTQIELVEHTPDTPTTSGQGEDSHDWVPDGDHELKRVKVYELIGSRWVDQGTAFCFGQFQEDTGEALLIARSEPNYNEIILSTAIRSNDVYQRQQDTLIVWTEPDGVDYALSFQDPEGCAEVWNFILEVQRHMNSADDQSLISSPLLGSEATSVTTASIIRSGHLPQPQLGIIGEIERAIKSLARTQAVKEKICEYIQQEEYLKSLIDVMHTAEDLESLENLHALCSITQTILMLNDHTLYEHILEDDIFFGVVGMLEYDPDFPSHKANYREFLHQASHFHQPIPIRDPTIQRKIHHTYRLQFLKDVVLARALDDSTFNVLNSCIIFNQIDIITHVQQDQTFLRDVVRLFVDEEMLTGAPNKRLGPGQQAQGPASYSPQVHSQPMIISLNGGGDNMIKVEDPTAMDVDQPQPLSSPKLNGLASLSTMNHAPSQTPPPPRKPGSYAFAPPDDLSEEEIALRREVIILVQQLCVMGKNVQLPARMALFRSLVDRGVLFGVQWALGLPEKEEANRVMISAAGEILSALLDHDLNGVRGHVLKQVVAIEKEREAKKKGAEKAETILEMASRIMAQSTDLAIQCQMGDALKVWMDLPSPDAPGPGIGPSEAGHPPGGSPKIAGRKDDPGTERYMDYFYHRCAEILFKPLRDLPDWRNVAELPLTREQTNRHVYLCDLLYNFIQQHQWRSQFYLIRTTIVLQLATLLKARDKHLRHAAFRIFRLLLKQGNPTVHDGLKNHDIFKPILDLTLLESRRDNLLSCSCQEFFETMRKDNMKELIKFCMTKHESEIRQLAETPLGGQRFELFIRKYEMNNEPLPVEENKTDQSQDERNWPDQGRTLDAEEEDYFNAEDDDDEPTASDGQQWSRTASSPTSPTTNNSINALKRKRQALGPSAKGHRPPLKSPPPLSALVDYGEDEEEPGPLEPPVQFVPSQGSPPQKTSSDTSPPPPLSPKLAHRQLSIPPPKRGTKIEEEDTDNILESLVRTKGRPPSPAPDLMASLGPMRPGEKRRRGGGDDDDDDDDELLSRLSKIKKSERSPQKESVATPTGGAPAPTTGGGLLGRTKNGDEPPKKVIKLKFGTAGLALGSTNPTTTLTPSPPSEGDAKVGDTG